MNVKIHNSILQLELMHMQLYSIYSFFASKGMVHVFLSSPICWHSHLSVPAILLEVIRNAMLVDGGHSSHEVE